MSSQTIRVLLRAPGRAYRSLRAFVRLCLAGWHPARAWEHTVGIRVSTDMTVFLGVVVAFLLALVMA